MADTTGLAEPGDPETRLTVRIPNRLADRLQAEIDRTGVNSSTIIRLALQAYLGGSRLPTL